MTSDVKCALADTEWRWGGAGVCFTSQVSESPEAPGNLSFLFPPRSTVVDNNAFLTLARVWLGGLVWT